MNYTLIIDHNRYAQLASDNVVQAQDTLNIMKQEWTALLISETAHSLDPASCKLMSVIRWRHFKAIRMLYLMAEDMEWKVTPVLQQFMRDMIGGFPDTKIIEDTHQKLRDLGRQSRNFISSRVKRMFYCMISGHLNARHTKVVPTVDDSCADLSWRAMKHVKIKKMTQTNGLKLKNSNMQMIMHPKTQASTSPEGLFSAAAATEWLFHYWQLPDNSVSLDQAWQSALLNRFDIARHVTTQKTVIIIGCAE